MLIMGVTASAGCVLLSPGSKCFGLNILTRAALACSLRLLAGLECLWRLLALHNAIDRLNSICERFPVISQGQRAVGVIDAFVMVHNVA